MSEPVEPDNEDIRYEKSDASPRALARFMLIMVLATLAVAFVVRGLYFSLAAREARQQPAPPIMRFEEKREPPAPRLETAPVDELAAFRADQDRITNTYGWIDKPNGIVRIPIDEAMRQLLERGLPIAPPTPETPRSGGAQ